MSKMDICVVPTISQSQIWSGKRTQLRRMSIPMTSLDLKHRPIPGRIPGTLRERKLPGMRKPILLLVTIGSKCIQNVQSKPDPHDQTLRFTVDCGHCTTSNPAVNTTSRKQFSTTQKPTAVTSVQTRLLIGVRDLGKNISGSHLKACLLLELGVGSTSERNPTSKYATRAQ